MKGRQGFTIVELIVVIAVISVLAAITIVSYGSWKHRTEDQAVRSDISQATSSLESYKNFNQDYPPNLAGTGFAASPTVALTLYTNAPQARTYENLTPDQNAQLFLNSCNANMPVTSADGNTTYNTACSFAGINIHVNGTSGSNIVFHGPTINQSDFNLTCGNPCDTATQAIINVFLEQGGSFPISVPKNQVSLPDPTVTTYGTATKYCLEGVSADYTDIAYHISSDQKTILSGTCPDDGSLHYP